MDKPDETVGADQSRFGTWSFFGTLNLPLLAKSQAAISQHMTCFVGEGSSAACSSKWIIFAGNSANLDESV
jgi:hypothetical protein